MPYLFYIGWPLLFFSCIIYLARNQCKKSDCCVIWSAAILGVGGIMCVILGAIATWGPESPINMGGGGGAPAGFSPTPVINGGGGGGSGGPGCHIAQATCPTCNSEYPQQACLYCLAACDCYNACNSCCEQNQAAAAALGTNCGLKC